MTDIDEIGIVAIIAYAVIAFALHFVDRRLTEVARERFEQLTKAALELEAAAQWRKCGLGPVGFVHF